MSTYRTLSDIYLGGAAILAGTILSTQDVGGGLPVNWVPPAAVDPLDTAAVTAFYAAGPQIMPILIRQQWSNVFVAPPVTYWRQISGSNQWQLMGLGANLAPIGM
jgi:hypothetical protein